MPSRRTFVAGALASTALSGLPAGGEAPESRQRAARPRRILVFDVNETMLDINALEPHFARAFGDGQAGVVFDAAPVLERGESSGAVLRLRDDRRRGVVDGRRWPPLAAACSCPPTTETVSSPERVRCRLTRMFGRLSSDLRRRAFGWSRTNSAPAAVEQQLKNAGLSNLFERSFSVDSVKRFKPAPEPYRYVATELKVTAGDLRMVAAHAWDVLGALQAGCAAAFVARPGKVLYPLGPKPDVISSDFHAVAEQIVVRDGAR